MVALNCLFQTTLFMGGKGTSSHHCPISFLVPKYIMPLQYPCWPKVFLTRSTCPCPVPMCDTAVPQLSGTLCTALNWTEALIWLKEHLPKPFPLVLFFNLDQFSSLALVLIDLTEKKKKNKLEDEGWKGERVRKILISFCCCGLCPMSCLLWDTTLGPPWNFQIYWVSASAEVISGESLSCHDHWGDVSQW